MEIFVLALGMVFLMAGGVIVMAADSDTDKLLAFAMGVLSVYFILYGLGIVGQSTHPILSRQFCTSLGYENGVFANLGYNKFVACQSTNGDVIFFPQGDYDRWRNTKVGDD